MIISKLQSNQKAPVNQVEDTEEVTCTAYWPLSVVGRILGGLFQQRDIDQSTGQNEQHCHSMGSPGSSMSCYLLSPEKSLTWRLDSLTTCCWAFCSLWTNTEDRISCAYNPSLLYKWICIKLIIIAFVLCTSARSTHWEGASLRVSCAVWLTRDFPIEKPICCSAFLSCSWCLFLYWGVMGPC